MEKWECVKGKFRKDVDIRVIAVACGKAHHILDAFEFDCEKRKRQTYVN